VGMKLLRVERRRKRCSQLVIKIRIVKMKSYMYPFVPQRAPWAVLNPQSKSPAYIRVLSSSVVCLRRRLFRLHVLFYGCKNQQQRPDS
jgi:hypothetical protein